MDDLEQKKKKKERKKTQKGDTEVKKDKKK